MDNDIIKTFQCRDERCVSELAMDQYVLGEMDAIERHATETAIGRCDGCQNRLEQVKAGFAALEGADRDAMLASIKAAVPEAEIADEVREAFAGHRPPAADAASSRSLIQRLADWFAVKPLPRLAAVMVPVLALAVILPVVLRDSPTVTDSEPPGVRTKGSIGFQVYQVADGQGELKMSGDRFTVGDELKYEVTLSRDGHLLIVGVEPGGKLYASYPPDSQGHSMPVKKGAEQRMDRSVVLSSLADEEWLYAVYCEQPFEAGSIRVDAETGKIEVPKGCSQSGFKMVGK